ncbi:type I toxin-antitoxin system Ibs family toxin [Cronobacter turicensis]
MKLIIILIVLLVISWPAY